MMSHGGQVLATTGLILPVSTELIRFTITRLRWKGSTMDGEILQEET